MHTKNAPGEFDCYANAEPDEPMFVLLARDEKAPDLVREWVIRRRRDDPTKADDVKEREALRCAVAMEAWRANHPKPYDEGLLTALRGAALGPHKGRR